MPPLIQGSGSNVLELWSAWLNTLILSRVTKSVATRIFFKPVITSRQVISNYLLSMLPVQLSASSVGTEPLIQSVSALIDIYSDENMPYDINFREGGYLERLQSSVDGVKKAVKAIDRRAEGGQDLRRRGEEVRENLVAFIQYRKQLGL